MACTVHTDLLPPSGDNQL